MPGAYDFTRLHDSFTQWKSEVWAEIFDGKNAIIPAKKSEVQAFGFDGMTEAFGRKFGQACDSHPLVTHMSLRQAGL
jgi:hypothetical protein